MLLNTTCTIQQVTRAQNATTRQMVDTWANKYVNVKCRIDGAEGAEFVGANKVVEKATHIIFMPMQYKVTQGNNRIIINGEDYDILQVTNAGGQGHHQEIFVEYQK